MHDFNYVTISSLDEAAQLLSEQQGHARLLAGGTDLIVNMRLGRSQPDWLVDAKHIPELSALTIDHHGLTIGAAVTCRQLWENEEVATAYPAIIDSATLIGGIQIQGRATIGGNLCNASPSADGIPTLIAYGAIAHIKSVRQTRQIPVEQICIAPGHTSLADDELLVKITIPPPVKHSGVKFLRFIPRNEMDIAVTNVAAMVELDDAGENFKQARIAIGAVAPTPLFVPAAGAALAGKPVSEQTIAAAADIVKQAGSPINDMRGTIAHRRQLAEVLTRRSLHAAVARAKGQAA